MSGFFNWSYISDTEVTELGQFDYDCDLPFCDVYTIDQFCQQDAASTTLFA